MKMCFKFVFVLSLLSLSNCKCGLVNWVSDWTDNTGHDAVGGKPLGLLGEAPFVSLTKRESVLTENEKLCRECMSQLPCRALKKCDTCYKYCKHDPTFTNDPTMVQNDAEIVSLPNPMAVPRLAKTPYHVIDYKEGETLDLICRIIGIADSSDIETLSIWVTTNSNKPPQSTDSRKGGPGQNLKLKDPAESFKPRKSEAGSPVLESRFIDYDSGEDPSAISNLAKQNGKINPGLIEGPPPFLRSNLATESSGIVVQPKEFQSDESDEDVPSVSVLTTTPLATKAVPAVLELTTSKPQPFSFLKALRQSPDKETGTRRGLLQNFLHGKKGDPETNILTSPQENNVGGLAEKPSNAEISGLNQAIQEVKEIVKNIQDEAQKASEKRLLGSPLFGQSPNIHREISPQVVDNFKDVNHYLVDRAQDALDTIKDPRENGNAETVGRPLDEHSEATKRIIGDLKNVPTYLLGKVKDTLNAFDLEPTGSSVGETLAQEQPNSGPRFGESDSMVGLTENPDLFKTELLTTPTTVKSKLEKYLEDLKERRQNKYSPDKFYQTSSTSTTPALLVAESNILQTPTESVGRETPLITDELQSPKDSVPTLMSRSQDLQTYENNIESSLAPKQLAKGSQHFMNMAKKSADENEAKVNLLKDKMRRYMENLKKPLEQKSQENPDHLSSLNNLSAQEKLRQIFKDTVQDPKREMLKKKLKDYVGNLKKPIESRLASNAKNLVRPLDSPLLGQEPDSLVGAPQVNPTETLPTEEPKLGRPFDPDLETRAGFESKPGVSNPISASLGQIVQSPSEPYDVFFVASGVKLPLKVSTSVDGTMDISVNLDKLCACKNVTCPKNHTAIEETISEILEKEAELKKQLSEDVAKTDNKTINVLTDGTTKTDNTTTNVLSDVANKTTNVLSDSIVNNDNKTTNILSEIVAKTDKETKNVISKRSPDISLFATEAPTYLKASNTAFPHTIIDKQQQAISNAVRQVQDNAEELRAQVSNNLNTAKHTLNAIRYPYPYNIAPALKAEQVINKINREQIAKEMILRQNLRQAEAMLQKNPQLELLNSNVLEKSTLPKFVDAGSKAINDNLAKLSEGYQYNQIRKLQETLNQLENQLGKYEGENAKLFGQEARRRFGVHRNEVVEKEVSLMSKIFNWLNNLPKNET